MFRVDRSSNRISRLTQKRFGDLALRERDHLQEWLANQPDALGEEVSVRRRRLLLPRLPPFGELEQLELMRVGVWH